MLKQLHLGNIANVAYGYSKLLRETGQDCSVLCYDLRHAISQPEWLDGDFDTSELDLDNFDASRPEYKRFLPPDWFRRINSADCFLKDKPYGSFSVLDNDWMDTLIHFSRRYGRRWALSEDDIASFGPLSEGLAKHFMVNYDVIFGYAYAAVPPFLWGMRPYVPVEIGTMRSIPFEDNPLGKLLALVYRTAPQVIITNPDVISSIKELKIENYTFVPHPLDEDIWKPSDAGEKLDLHKKYHADFILFAPARQDWAIKENHKYLRAFAGVIERGLKVKLIVTKWGGDVDRSVTLIRELGIQDFVVWVNPLPEQTLIKFFDSADLVLDQFGSCRTFGLITPKAMSCGTPVLISFNPAVHEWCFDQPPPVIQTNTEKEIFDALVHYLSNGEQRSLLAEQSRSWVLRHHSKSIITNKMASILDSVCAAPKPETSAFHSLKQKRIELKHKAERAYSHKEASPRSIVHETADDNLVSFLKTHLDLMGIREPRVLDLGCGHGALTYRFLSIPGINLTGVDLSPAMIDLAKKAHPNADFLVDDIEALSFEENIFDVVFCNGVLHHLPCLDMGLKEVRRILKPGGILVAREPNAANLSTGFPELAFAHLCLRHFLSFTIGPGTIPDSNIHGYHRTFNFRDFTEEIGRYFRVIDSHTELAVSCFYDMLTNPDTKKILESLENTLIGHPGQNVVTVATKGYLTGVDDVVKEKISQTDKSITVDSNHFPILYKFAKRLFKTYHRDFRNKILSFNSPDMGKDFWRNLKSERILISSNNTDESNATAEHYRSIMSKHMRARKKAYNALRIGWQLSKPLLGWLGQGISAWNKGRKRRTWVQHKKPCIYAKAIDSLQNEPQAYDTGFFFVTEDISAEVLIKAMEAVCDHGIIYLQINRGVTISNIDDKHKAYFNRMAVLSKLNSGDGNWRSLFISKHVHTQKDFYQALSAAMEKAKEKFTGDQLALIDNILAKVHSKIGRLQGLRGKSGDWDMMLEPQKTSPSDV